MQPLGCVDITHKDILGAIFLVDVRPDFAKPEMLGDPQRWVIIRTNRDHKAGDPAVPRSPRYERPAGFAGIALVSEGGKDSVSDFDTAGGEVAEILRVRLRVKPDIAGHH